MERGFIGGAKDEVSAGLSLNDEAFVSSVLAFLMGKNGKKGCDGESFHRLSVLSDAPYSRSRSSYLHAIKVGREKSERERWRIFVMRTVFRERSFTG